MFLRVIAVTARTQGRLILRDIECMLPLLISPLQTLIALAILSASGRLDLASYALCAGLLMTIGQMGLFIGSEVVANDRYNQVLELLVATPTPYTWLLATRTLIIVSTGLIGLVEGWLIARFVFDITLAIPHPGLLIAALAATVLAGTGTSILTSALFSLARTTRTLQNAINGPLYLLGGVLVPVGFLPVWLQPFSPLIFFYWAANLVRAALDPAPPTGAGFQLAMVLGLGAVTAGIGAWVMRIMLDKLRAEGRLGLA